jgi:hypothetical protein
MVSCCWLREWGERRDRSGGVDSNHQIFSTVTMWRTPLLGEETSLPGGGRWFVMVESRWSYWGERKSLVRDMVAGWLARTNYGCCGQQWGWSREEKNENEFFFFFLGGGMGLVFKVFFGCRGCLTMAERGSNRLGKVCEGCGWFNLSNKEGSKCAWPDLWRGGGSNTVAKKKIGLAFFFFIMGFFFRVFFFFFRFPLFVCVDLVTR